MPPALASSLSPAAPARELALAGVAGLATFLASTPLLGLAPLAVTDAELAALATASPGAAWSAGGLAGLATALSGEAAALRLPLALLGALASALVFLVARRLDLPRLAALTVALLGALHPLAVEPAAWLARCGSVLGLVLGLTALLVALGCAAPVRRVALPLAVLALVALPLALDAPREPLPAGLGPATRLACAPLAVGEHLSRWLLVSPLSWSHAHPALLGEGERALGSLTALSTLALVVVLRRRAPLVAAGLGFLLAVALAGALFPRAAELAPESEGARAGLGLALAVVAGTRALWTRRPRLAAVLALLACAGLAARSQERQRAWHDEDSLQAAALAADPGHVRAELARARLALRDGRLSAAERALAGLAARRPDVGEAALLQGELALRRALVPGQEEHLLAARTFLERARTLAPENVRVLECLGEVHQRARDEEGALRLHEEALAREPWRARARELAGKACLALGDAPGAAGHFARLTRDWPRSVEGWTGAGHALLAQRDAPGARAAFERALALEPDHPEANSGLAQVLELAGERAAALAHHRRALAVNPELADSLLGGALLLQDEDAERALLWLEHLVARQGAPRPHVRAHLAAARLLLARGARATARERLATVLAFNPEQAEARALLAELERGGG